MAKEERPIVQLRPGPGGGRGGPHGMMMPHEKPKDTKGTVKRLLKYIGSSKYLMISLLAIVLLITLLGLAGPALQGEAINKLVANDQTGAVQIDWNGLLKILLVMGGVYGLSALCTYLQGIFAAKLSQKTVRTMRDDLFSKMVRLPIRFFDTHQHGDLMSRMTNDVENVSNTISQSIAVLISGVITLVGTIVIMLLYSPLLTLVSMVVIPMSLFASWIMAKFMRKYFVQQQTLLGRLNGHIEEMVSGYKTVMAFSKEEQAVSDFKQISAGLKKTSIKAQVFGGFMGPVMNVIGNFGFLLIAAVGGYLALGGIIKIGVIQMFLQYSKQFTRPINEIANQYTQIQTAIAGAERVFAIMDEAAEIDAQAPSKLASVRGALEFKNVWFSYEPGQPVLKDFNLSVKEGQKIAIVGATGAGKTTVVNLLTRFYEIESGLITIDGVDITALSKEELRRNIAIVLQDTVLFHDTIAANICYGKENAAQEQIEAAAKTANAHRFISRLPDGYQTVLSESGGNLSQGQRQLLSIARAVLADPKILILDEATSSVDTRTEMRIQEAMIKLMANRTSLIIAHRLSTIRDADCIIVLEGGRIAEAGSHDELLTFGGAYARLYNSQFEGNQT